MAFTTPPRAATTAETLRTMAELLVHRDLPLAVRAWDGTRSGPDDAEVTLVVRSPLAVRHLLWAPGELGLVRAHVQGHLDLDGDVFSLLSLRRLLGSTGDDVSIRATPADWWQIAQLARRIDGIGWRPAMPPEEARVRGRLGSRGRVRSAVQHHYDVGNDFYRLLLGASLTYSCAYWHHEHTTLDDAQDAKHELICRKLGLRPGHRLLDVGCGWGSMAIHAARHHDADVVGITVSPQQADLARARVRAAGLDDRVEIRLQDYRDVTDGPFDAISSIGMFEHVASGQVATYLTALRSLLRPGGRLLNHAISRPDPGAPPEVTDRSFMGRYVFPDSTLHEAGTVVTAMDAIGLEVRDVQSLREHYARTLRAWATNLEVDWHHAQRLVGPGRARVWRLYLAACALGFEEHRTSVHQVLAVHAHVDGRSEMPRTRAGIEPGEAPQTIDLRVVPDPGPALSASPAGVD